MLEVLLCSLVSAYGFYRYIRSYKSQETWPTVGTTYKGQLHRIGRGPHVYAVTFMFGPAFGAAALFMAYQELGGEVNLLSLFLLLSCILLAPFIMINRFKARKP
jgi:hypothetical protein